MSKQNQVNPKTTEAALIEARRAKAVAVRTRGDNPFTNRVSPGREPIGALRFRVAGAVSGSQDGKARYDTEQVQRLAGDGDFTVCGRVMARRGFGKVSFLSLRDDSGEIQLFAKQDEMGESFDALEDIDIADHVEAVGPLTVTKTGELSVMLKRLRLISKALRPLPDKWHGLKDVEQRYRHRYVDLIANPLAGVTLRARSIIVQGLRDFLESRGFLEVETPTLHSLVGGAAAHPFSTHHKALGLDLFLRIAPELYLKRLLVGGFERVYEIGRCYRNEGISTRHNPEFTMLEFYQAYATYETLMPMTESLFRHVDLHLAEGLDKLGLREVYEGWVGQRAFTLDEPFVRLAMRDGLVAALQRAGLAADEVLAHLKTIAQVNKASGGPDEATQMVKQWATTSERSRKVDWGNLRRALSHCHSEGERIFVAYEYLVEPFLTEDYRSQSGTHSLPVFILDYPEEVSPLARRKEADSTLTDRFELFVDGIERCNAFSELNDPEDQAQRFRAQVELKSRGAEETMDYDEDYIRALEHGMPPAAGFGLGVDRLVMMLTGQPSIRDVIAFPLLRPEG